MLTLSFSNCSPNTVEPLLMLLSFSFLPFNVWFQLFKSIISVSSYLRLRFSLVKSYIYLWIGQWLHWFTVKMLPQIWDIHMKPLHVVYLPAKVSKSQMHLCMILVLDFIHDCSAISTAKVMIVSSLDWSNWWCLKYW
jgi:hypothetical protein